MGTYTQNYNFYIPDGSEFGEIIKLVLEPNFTIIDQQLKNLKDKFENYYTETEIDEKFKNFCPYNIGDIYQTTNDTNPATIWLGTTWEKIEDCVLRATKSGQASKETGGSDTVVIDRENLPNEKLNIDSFSLSRGTMDITGSGYPQSGIGYINRDAGGSVSGAFYNAGALTYGIMGNDKIGGSKLGFQASRAWTGTTSEASPQTETLGSGQALDITPKYYTVHTWLRLS